MADDDEKTAAQRGEPEEIEVDGVKSNRKRFAGDAGDLEFMAQTGFEDLTPPDRKAQNEIARRMIREARETQPDED